MNCLAMNECFDIMRAWHKIVFVHNNAVKSQPRYQYVFSVNILGDEINLLHVDFRPYIDTIVLNNNVNGVWVSEVR